MTLSIRHTLSSVRESERVSNSERVRLKAPTNGRGSTNSGVIYTSMTSNNGPRKEVGALSVCHTLSPLLTDERIRGMMRAWRKEHEKRAHWLFCREKKKLFFELRSIPRVGQLHSG